MDKKKAKEEVDALVKRYIKEMEESSLLAAYLPEPVAVQFVFRTLMFHYSALETYVKWCPKSKQMQNELEYAKYQVDYVYSILEKHEKGGTHYGS